MDPLRDLDERGLTRIEGVLSLERRQRLADRLEALFAEEGEAAARALLALDDPQNDALSADGERQSGFLK